MPPLTLPLAVFGLLAYLGARRSRDRTWEVLSAVCVDRAGASQVSRAIEYASLTSDCQEGRTRALDWALFWRVRGFAVVVPRRFAEGKFERGDTAVVCRPNEVSGLDGAEHLVIWNP